MPWAYISLSYFLIKASSRLTTKVIDSTVDAVPVAIYKNAADAAAIDINTALAVKLFTTYISLFLRFKLIFYLNL